jgi:hypothetical protein
VFPDDAFKETAVFEVTKKRSSRRGGWTPCSVLLFVDQSS